MPKSQHKKSRIGFTKKLQYSEVWLLIFLFIFGLVGSYTWLTTLAAPDDVAIVRNSFSAEEQAWFGAVSGAALIILAAGPVAALIFWWVWRRSGLVLWIKLLLTITPFLIVMALT